jgi:hypothetical protein
VIDRTKAISFGPWGIRADVEATKRCYQQTEEVPPEGCGCDPCRNFALVQEQAYPPEILTLFEDLGIDRRKPYELSHYCRTPSGLHLYGGWLYFCGSIERGPEPGKPNPYRLNPTFSIELFRPDTPRHPFSEFPCVQVDFYTELPWKSDLPEAD